MTTSSSGGAASARPLSIYWYAPFNNANELELAAAFVKGGDALAVQALRTRFGKPLPVDAPGFELRRDLPEPAGDDGSRRWAGSRAGVAFTRAYRRHRCVLDGSYDLLHIHTVNPFTDFAAFPALRRKRPVPFVVSVHNVRPHEHQLPQRAETRLLGAAYRSADALIVAHDVLREQLAVEFDIDPGRIHVVGLPIPEVPPPSVTPVLEGPPRVLFFGTFRDNKGIPLLLEAIDGVRRDLDVVFHFAGRGDAELERLVADAARRDDRIVAELGYVETERQHTLFRSAVFTVVPYTEFSAQSGVLREAYAYGLPVVASDIGALGRTVRDEDTGWTVTPGSVPELRAALEHAIVDEAARDRFRANMARFAEARSIPNIALAFRAVYERASG